MYDKVFGELHYDYAWRGKRQVAIFGRDYPIEIYIDADEDEEFSTYQYESFKKYLRDEPNVWEFILKAVFDYYQEECEEYRLMYGERADEFAPIVNTIEDILGIISNGSINIRGIPVSYDYGISFDCTWDETFGVGVRIKDGQVIEIGPQNITF